MINELFMIHMINIEDFNFDITLLHKSHSFYIRQINYKGTYIDRINKKSMFCSFVDHNFITLNVFIVQGSVTRCIVS